MLCLLVLVLTTYLAALFFWKRVWEISIMSSLDVSWHLLVKLSELGGLCNFSLVFFKELNNISGEGPLVLSSSL